MMTREDFIDYLTANDCEVIRIANQGYTVMRNKANNKMSGVPATDPPLAATVCRVCKTLEVDPPEEAGDAKELIDHIQSSFEKKSFSPENGGL